MNVLMAGVGGQGIILSSDVLSEVMLRSGLDVKKSEIHGMAQRGGSVMSHVRSGERVASPIIPEGACDILLAFEELEAARYLGYLKSETLVIVNRVRLPPPSVLAGKDSYPDVGPILRGHTQRVCRVEASQAARRIGNPRGLNIVMLGVLSVHLPPEEGLWIETLKDMLPLKIRDINIEGFRAGRALDVEGLTGAQG